MKIKTNLASKNLTVGGGGEVFGGRNLGRLNAYHNDGVRLFLNARCVVPCGGIGLLTVNGGYQTILFYTSALATLLFSSDSTEAYLSFKIDNSRKKKGV